MPFYEHVVDDSPVQQDLEADTPPPIYYTRTTKTRQDLTP